MRGRNDDAALGEADLFADLGDLVPAGLAPGTHEHGPLRRGATHSDARAKSCFRIDRDFSYWRRSDRVLRAAARREPERRNSGVGWPCHRLEARYLRNDFPTEDFEGREILDIGQVEERVLNACLSQSSAAPDHFGCGFVSRS